MAEEKMNKKIMQKVSDTVCFINDAKTFNDVVLHLHSFALLFFPINTSSLSGVISEQHWDQLKKEDVSLVNERSQLWEVFYRGVAFPTFARFLIYDVASKWLSCLPITARTLVYDIFFVKGLFTEVVQAVIPCLDHNTKAVRSNAERLVVICLLENEGILQMAREFSVYLDSEESSQSVNKLTVSRVAQLVASVPDKSRSNAPKFLSPHYFFKNITIQLLAGAEERRLKADGENYISSNTDIDYTFQFIGEMFTRICRRGSADLLLNELIPHILRRVRSFLSSHTETYLMDGFVLDSSFKFWFSMMEIIKDAYVVEKMTEQILHHLVAESANNVEAYWILWILFQRSFKLQTTVRFMFVEKFILLKVFPLCCLRWILQFAIFGCPPDDNKLKKGENQQQLLETVQRVVVVWSKQEFVQSAPLEQQIYVTAAAGLMLENISREELDSAKDLMRSILEGVSYRLENPDDLVRKMACSIALVFSKVIDPKNPLYLDDSFREEHVDWEFGLATSKNTSKISEDRKNGEPSSSLVHELEVDLGDISTSGSKVKGAKKRSSKHKLVEEIVDPATLNDELLFSEEEEDDNSSEVSDGSSDSSLEPYDLTDDDTDLKKKISQLVDVVGALRKSDDPDGVERALDVAEQFVRASPDELKHVASDLVRTLVQARCDDTAVEGEEESSEEKREKALVALLVTCPFESANAINKLLYSPTLNVSQRVLILDVIANAAQELSSTKTIVQKNPSRPHISEEPEAWFLPSSKGPPGAGTWKEVPDSVTPLSMTYRFERNLPLKSGQIKKGKTRRWGHRPENVGPPELDWSRNKFPLYAAAFMLPAMQGFNKKSHGVDLIGRDFIVLGKLIYMLGVCMRCMAFHPEASALAPQLLDMLSSREICRHKEAFVRKSVIFGASSILRSLHPSFVASAFIEGNQDISRGLEWIRTWALQIAESDSDRECCTTAMACLQLHAEMSLQASRAFESAGNTSLGKSIGLPPNPSKGQVKIPGFNTLFLG